MHTEGTGKTPAPASPVTWQLFEDPHEFLREAAPLLQRDPATAAMLTANAQRVAASIAAGDPAPEYPRWFGLARAGEGGEAVALAMRTAWFVPFPLWVLPMADDAARTLAETLVARGEVVGGVNGSVDAARAVANRVAQLTGGTIEVLIHLRQWEIREVTPSAERDAVAGTARPATPADRDTAIAWWQRFWTEAEEQAGRAPTGRDSHGSAERAVKQVGRRTEDGNLWMWEVDGEVVCMVGFTDPNFGVVTVSPVFTPAAHRGKGYASALVAEVSRRLLGEGHRVCLFTDQANPVSNGVYARIGYEPIGDNIELAIHPGA